MERKYFIYFAAVYSLCFLGVYEFNIQIPMKTFCKTSLQENNSIDSCIEIYSEIESNLSVSPTVVLPSQNLWRPTNTSNPIQSDRLIEQYTWIKYLSNHFDHTKNFKAKSILLFDTGVMPSIQSKHIQCPGYELKLCTVTKSEDLPNPYEMVGNFDAVVFAYVHRYGRNITNLVLSQHVKQVIYTLETAYQATVDFGLNNAISATYFSGSDIFIPYGKWIPYDDSIEPIIPPRIKIEKRLRNNLHYQEKNFADGRIGRAVIFVSNCRNTNNNRMGFVKVLQQYMTVDVYGKCGALQMNCTKIENRNGSCMDRIIQRYKYYLAFENSNCWDYITEKVYKNALRNDVVPIVLGAHPDNYKRLLPPHSYIHVEDFDSPKQLAGYLNFLSKNDSLYNKYFEWKSIGELHPAASYTLCRICGMLFYSDYVDHPDWDRAHSTWKDNNKCLTKNQWYWNNKTL